MRTQYKFENVDILAALQGIMQQNTGFYQTDLEIDKQMLFAALESTFPDKKHSSGSAAHWAHTAYPNAMFF